MKIKQYFYSITKRTKVWLNLFLLGEIILQRREHTEYYFPALFAVNILVLEKNTLKVFLIIPIGIYLLRYFDMS